MERFIVSAGLHLAAFVLGVLLLTPTAKLREESVTVYRQSGKHWYVIDYHDLKVGDQACVIVTVHGRLTRAEQWTVTEQRNGAYGRTINRDLLPAKD